MTLAEFAKVRGWFADHNSVVDMLWSNVIRGCSVYARMLNSLQNEFLADFC